MILLAAVLVVAALAGGRPRVKTASKTTGQHKKVENSKMEKATFAAGCFWGVEETFRQIKGVTDTMVGYTGGTTENPTYEQVCRSKTGHAEAVQVTYDPTKVTYEQLLDVFWKNHDPTQIDRQGPDYGTQYRSAIFYHTPEQQKIALESKNKLDKSGKYSKPIATQIISAVEFYKAEDYHQKYLEKRGLSNCHI
jgi:peptide-methionine (S)-S-oxide reductase